MSLGSGLYLVALQNSGTQKPSHKSATSEEVCFECLVVQGFKTCEL